MMVKQESDEVLRLRLSQTISIGILKDPEARRPLRIYAGPRADSHEDFTDEQINELLTVCLYVRRWGQEKKTRYPWTTRVPSSTRFGKDVVFLFGRLDKAFKSGRDVLE